MTDAAIAAWRKFDSMITADLEIDVTAFDAKELALMRPARPRAKRAKRAKDERDIWEPVRFGFDCDDTGPV